MMYAGLMGRVQVGVVRDFKAFQRITSAATVSSEGL